MGRWTTAVRVVRTVSRAGDSLTLADRIRLAVRVFFMPLVTREKVIQELDDIDRARQKVVTATAEAAAASAAFATATINRISAERTLERSEQAEVAQLDYSLSVLRAYATGTELPADLVDPSPEPGPATPPADPPITTGPLLKL